MLRRLTVVLTSLSILACVQSISVSGIKPTERFCRTLLLPGYKMFMANPHASKPFKFFAFWLKLDLVFIYIFCPGEDDRFSGAVVQLQSEGKPYGTFIQQRYSPTYEFVNCPPGENNTVYNFTEPPVRTMGFWWVPPPEMEWANVTV